MFQLFRGLPKGLVSVLEHGWDLVCSRCLGAAENKKDQCSLLLLQRAHGVGDRGQCRLAASPSGGKDKSGSMHPTFWLVGDCPRYWFLSSTT